MQLPSALPATHSFTNFFVFSDGEIAGNGPFVGTATNLDTGKTIKINEGGSFSVVELSDGSVTVTSNGFVISSLFGTCGCVKSVPPSGRELRP